MSPSYENKSMIFVEVSLPKPKLIASFRWPRRIVKHINISSDFFSRNAIIACFEN